MVVDTHYAVDDWIKVGGEGSLSPFTKKLIIESDRYSHVLVRARPGYSWANRDGITQFDPRIVVVAVESMRIGNNPIYDNVKKARNLMGSLVEPNDRVISEGRNGLPYPGEMIGKESVLGFLDDRDNLDGLSFADNMEAYQEMIQLHERGEPSPLHRIDDREEAIARRLWLVYQQPCNRIYMVLEHHHLISLNTYPHDENKRERGRYLLYDFLDLLEMPHIIVAPQLPKIYTDINEAELATDWWSAITDMSRGCQTYDMQSATSSRRELFFEELLNSRPDLKARLISTKRSGNDNVDKVINEVTELEKNGLEKKSGSKLIRDAQRASRDNYFRVYDELMEHPEIKKQLEELERREKEDFMARIKRIVGETDD